MKSGAGTGTCRPSLVGPREPEVRHVAEPEVVHQSERVSRTLDDDGAVFKIEPGDRVDAFGVGGEIQRSRVHQRLEDGHRLIVRPEAAHAALPDGNQRRGGHRRQERLHCVLEVEVVEHLLDRRVVGKSVGELKRPEPRLDAVGHGDRRPDVRGHLGFGHVAQLTFSMSGIAHAFSNSTLSGP